MRWCIDLDGVITSNPDFFRWWTYQLKKKGNKNGIHILTARNPSRIEETIRELEFWGISYDQLHTMDESEPRGLNNLGIWKLNMIIEIKPDIWIENEIKAYKAVGVDFDKLPKTLNIINI
jgi:hypothetical protein